MGKPNFIGTSAYSCASNAPVCCETARVCKGRRRRNNVTNALGDDGEFKNDALLPTHTPSGTDEVIWTSITTEAVRSRSFALRTDFSNSNGGG
ncbi:hypothetical protein C8A05DRAFT_39433, partial [Staphylotrichum tortipilum]